MGATKKLEFQVSVSNETDDDFEQKGSQASNTWVPTSSLASVYSTQSACSVLSVSGRTAVRNRLNGEEAAPLNRCAIYALLILFIGLKLFEGILSNNISRKDGKARWGAQTDNYLEFNYALAVFGDCIMRMAIAYPIIKYQKINVRDCFQGVSSRQIINTMFARFLVQMSEVLAIAGVVYLVASMANVIKQAQIPLVGLLGYLMLNKSLTSDQTIYAITIVPLAMQFCLLKGDGSGENHWIGFVAAGSAVVMTASANVFVEKLLKNDWSHVSAWSAQYIMAVLDLPAMFAVYVFMTAFERSIGIECRSWNPLDESNVNNWQYILAFTCSGTGLGIVRLMLLSLCDALWLNLSCVWVMGFLWLAELLQAQITGDQTVFTPTKALCLVGLTVILVGYELATRKADELEQDAIFEEQTVEETKEFEVEDTKEFAADAILETREIAAKSSTDDESSTDLETATDDELSMKIAV